MLEILSQVIGPDKLGGWVRSGVGAVLVIVIAKWPGLGAILDPSTQAAIGVVVAGLAVGIWQQLTKSTAGKVAMVDALAKDPNSPVKGTVMANTAAGNAISESLPGNTTAVAGSPAAAAIAKSLV